MLNPRKTICLGAIVCASIAGCTSTGTINADLVKGERAVAPVTITWKSTDGAISGTMTAVLPGSTYQGRFMQVTRETDTNAFAPLWSGWPDGWSDWNLDGYPGEINASQFSTVYTGRVVANLKNTAGGLMRCRFNMNHPSQGMTGGGSGECQAAGGRNIQATF